MIELYLRDCPNNSADLLKWWSDNFHTLTIKPQIDIRALSNDQALVRFMDLPKLCDLLANSRLILPLLGRFIDGDPYECSASKSYKHMHRPQLEDYVLLRRKYAPYLFTHPEVFYDWFGGGLPFEKYVQGLTEEDLRRTAWFLERERLKNDLACSCWYKGPQESDAMWRIYANHIGVAVISSVSRMKAGIKSYSIPKVAEKDFKLVLARVHYDDVTESGSSEPWLIKRKAFQHEKEVRLFCDCPIVDSVGLELKVDLASFIERIVITPFAEDWQSEAIRRMIQSGPFPQLSISKSPLMRAPKNSLPFSELCPTLYPAIGRSTASVAAKQPRRTTSQHTRTKGLMRPPK